MLPLCSLWRGPLLMRLHDRLFQGAPVLLAPVLWRLAWGQQQQGPSPCWLFGAGLLEGFGRQADADLVLIALQAQGLEELSGCRRSAATGAVQEKPPGHAHRDVAEAQQQIQVPAAGEIEAGLEIRFARSPSGWPNRPG